MSVPRLLLICLSLFWLMASPVMAQEQAAPSRCLAIAQTLPHVSFASFMPSSPMQASSTQVSPTQASFIPAQAGAKDEVRITYAGHSTYVVETPGGVRIATDYNGAYGSDPLPDVVTMNKAHRTHYTETPDPGIAHVLRGWNPDGGPASHALGIGDVYVRNVPTDIRTWGGDLERDANSIFIFEVAGLCIGHLGHLHIRLTDAHYAAIGRLDVVMVPIDGGMTLSLDGMSEIAGRLSSSIVLPMHRHSTPIGAFTGRMGEGFAVEFRDSPSLTVSLRTLPRQRSIIVLKGV
jgi:L-ascorbate metabolism protein UlaG (beta-lactamase superfamily)